MALSLRLCFNCGDDYLGYQSAQYCKPCKPIVKDYRRVTYYQLLKSNKIAWRQQLDRCKRYHHSHREEILERKRRKSKV